MGVDYTAFVCWGQRIKARRNLVDQLEANSPLLSKYSVGYAEYGAANYGGDSGFVLTINGTYAEVDVKHDPDAKPIPRDRDWNQVDAVMRLQDVAHDLRKAGVEVECEGEPGWFVCGRVW